MVRHTRVRRTRPMTATMTATTAIAATVMALAACSTTPSTTPAASASPEPTVSAQASQAPAYDLQLTSEDFAHADTLADWATGAGFGGQCTGDNLNPQLSWSGLPEDTVSVAITMVDESAGDWVHWLHLNIPAEVTSVERGGSGELPGVTGRNGLRTQEYFGPCPPSGEHHYTFTVWALDTMLDLEDGAQYGEFIRDRADHVLAEASLTGVRAYGSDDS